MTLFFVQLSFCRMAASYLPTSSSTEAAAAAAVAAAAAAHLFSTTTEKDMTEDDMDSLVLMSAIGQIGCYEFLRRRGYVHLYSQRRRQSETSANNRTVFSFLSLFKLGITVELRKSACQGTGQNYYVAVRLLI